MGASNCLQHLVYVLFSSFGLFVCVLGVVDVIKMGQEIKFSNRNKVHDFALEKRFSSSCIAIRHAWHKFKLFVIKYFEMHLYNERECKCPKIEENITSVCCMCV